MMTKRSDIEAALAKLPCLPGMEVHLNSLLIFLEHVDSAGPGTRPAKFTAVLASKKDAELDVLADLSEQLAGHLERLRQPDVAVPGNVHNTHLTLPAHLRKTAAWARQAKLSVQDQGTVDRRTVDDLNRIGKLAIRLANHIDAMHQSSIEAVYGWYSCHELTDNLHYLATKAREARGRKETKSHPSGAVMEPPKGGRPENLRARTVAEVLAVYFHKITGKPPSLTIDAYAVTTRPSGPFFEFVKTVFAILGFTEDPEHFAREAKRKFREVWSKN